jgi:CRP-like cAMP-binding protein
MYVASTGDLDVLAELRQMPMLGEVPREIVVDLATRVVQRRVHAGTRIIEQGKPSTHLLMLVRGAAKIVRTPERSEGSHVPPTMRGGGRESPRTPERSGQSQSSRSEEPTAAATTRGAAREGSHVPPTMRGGGRESPRTPGPQDDRVDPKDEIIVNVLRGPTVVPDPSLLDGAPAGASVVVLRSSQLFAIDRNVVLRIAHPSMGRALAKRFAAEVRAQERRLEQIVVGSVEERVRRLLDALSADHGTALGSGRFIAIPLRRRDLASMVDATTETVSRLLAKLEREGEARSTRDGIWWRTIPRQSGVSLVPDAVPEPPRSEQSPDSQAGSERGSGPGAPGSEPSDESRESVASSFGSPSPLRRA